MSTQVIRNLLNSQVDAVLSKAKQKVREEGKKQLRKLKQQIPTPQELTDKLKTDINQDSCSTEGQMKFNEKLDETQAKIDTLKTAIDQGISTLETTNETLNKVVGPDGVLEKIKVMPQVLNPVVTSLNIVSQAASTLITAVGFIPVIPPGGVTTYDTLLHISSIISSIKDNISFNTISNSSPNTAGWIGKVSSYCKPKYILGEFTTNLLVSPSGLVSKWKLPLVLKPIASFENNKIASSLALKINLLEFIITWFPWYVPGASGIYDILY